MKSWEKVELSPSHAYLLMIVIEEPGVSPGAMSKEMQLTPSTITRLIEKLEERKLVVRITEGKSTNVYPSPKAKQMLPKLKECLGDFVDAYSKFLSKTENTKLVQSIHKLADSLPG